MTHKLLYRVNTTQLNSQILDILYRYHVEGQHIASHQDKYSLLFLQDFVVAVCACMYMFM